MKPPKFSYHAPSTLKEALSLLSDLGDSAVVLSGGQSLIPMLNLRLANPSDVIDLGSIDGLTDISLVEGFAEVGAMVTHSRMETDPLISQLVPLAKKAASYIGYRAIRNRGTLCGSVAHADPAAEWPAVILALDGQVELSSAEGTRSVAGEDFFESMFTTAKRPDELISAVRLSTRFVDNWGFSEFQRRTGDFAAVAVAVACVREHGSLVEARISIAGVAEKPVRCPEAEEALMNGSTTSALDAAESARDAFDPLDDAHGSTAYRKRLVFAETQRAVTQALGTSSKEATNA